MPTTNYYLNPTEAAQKAKEFGNGDPVQVQTYLVAVAVTKMVPVKQLEGLAPDKFVEVIDRYEPDAPHFDDETAPEAWDGKEVHLTEDKLFYKVIMKK
jgi:hypothetical protein